MRHNPGVNHAPADDGVEVWRVSAAGRIGSVIGVGIWLVVAFVVTLFANDVLTAVLLWLFGVAGIVMAWRWAFVPFVELRATDVVIQNQWACTAVPYCDIASVDPGYWGVLIQRRRGNAVQAWAVQKSNLRQWMGSVDTRADRLAAAIRTRADLD
jgi:hypothetical protein